MSEQKKIITVKFYDDLSPIILPDEDVPLFTRDMTEPPIPKSTYLEDAHIKYMVRTCYPYKDKDGEESWMATVQPVEKMGVGYNVPNFNPKSKIWGDEAILLQRTRNDLQARGIDTDILEDMKVDITKLTPEAIEELESVAPPTTEERLLQELQSLKDELTSIKEGMNSDAPK